MAPFPSSWTGQEWEVTCGSSAPRLRSQAGRLDGRWAVLLGSGTSGLGSAPCSPGSPVTYSWWGGGMGMEGMGECGGLGSPSPSTLTSSTHPSSSSKSLTLGHTGYSMGQTVDAESPRCLCRSSPGRSEKSHTYFPFPHLPTATWEGDYPGLFGSLGL